MTDKPPVSTHGARPDIRIELSVRVSDDSYESKLSFPTESSPENIAEMFKGWMAALKVALDSAALAEKPLP